MTRSVGESQNRSFEVGMAFATLTLARAGTGRTVYVARQAVLKIFVIEVACGTLGDALFGVCEIEPTWISACEASVQVLLSTSALWLEARSICLDLAGSDSRVVNDEGKVALETGLVNEVLHALLAVFMALKTLVCDLIVVFVGLVRAGHTGSLGSADLVRAQSGIAFVVLTVAAHEPLVGP